MKIDQELIKLYAKIELAKREFFYYCNLKAPDFYKPERKYLVKLCNELQEFYESDDEVLIINLPPRHGFQFLIGKLKTRLNCGFLVRDFLTKTLLPGLLLNKT